MHQWLASWLRISLLQLPITIPVLYTVGCAIWNVQFTQPYNAEQGS